jgi:hypothetical protein
MAMNAKKLRRRSWLTILLGVSVSLTIASNAPADSSQDQTALPPPLPTELVGVWEPVALPGEGKYHIADFFGNTGWMFGLQELAYWDGNHWEAYPLPEYYPGSNNLVAGRNIISVASLSSNDIWAIDPADGFHWDGQQWQLVSIPKEYDDSFVGLDFVSPTRGWLIGDDIHATTETGAGLVFDWDGRRWTKRRVPGTSGFWGVDMLSPADGWIVESEGHLLRWNGHDWHFYSETPLQGHIASLRKPIAMVNASDGWVIGYERRDGRNHAGQGILWHWDGAQWSEFQRVRLPLESIAMVSSDFGWAVGGDWGKGESLLLHWDGQTWTEYPISADSPLSFVWANSTEDGWILAGHENIPPYDKVQVFRYRLTPSATATLPPTASAIPSEIPTTPATSSPVSPTASAPSTTATVHSSGLGSNSFSNILFWLFIIALFVVGVSLAVLILRRRRN